MSTSLKIAALLLALASPSLAQKEQVEKILKDSGVSGGLVVHLGCGDGTLTAALRAGDSFLVHGLDPIAANIDKARQTIRQAGVYGPASADALSGKTLPYVDNLVRLLVVSNDCGVARAEMERVICPGGVLIYLDPQAAARDPKWIKPWPADIDEWTHWQHDAGRNAVARDQRIGPPRRIQWVAPPLYSRGHEVPSSVGAAVTSKGRLFYMLDEGQTGMYDMPSRWTLLARDAFSGVLLWKLPVPDWGPAAAKGGFGSQFNARRLATDGEHLYLPTGDKGQLTAVAAATGQVVKTWPDTSAADEVLVADGLLLAMVTTPQGKDRTVLAIGTGTWVERWRQPVPGFVRTTLTLDAGRAFYQTGEEVVAVDANSGKAIWRHPLGKLPEAMPKAGRGGPGVTIVAVPGKLVVSVDKRLFALEAATGQVLWQNDAGGRDLFVIGDLIWSGMSAVGLADGKPRQKINPASVYSKGHHPRCYPNKATSRYLITNNRGAEFLGLDGEELVASDWLRGNCAHGVLPANGLLYVPPNQCFCYGGVMLLGFKSLASETMSRPATEPATRLERGPAYTRERESGIGGIQPGDWPIYRGGPRRLGGTAVGVGPSLTAAWQVKVGGQLTPPVVAGGQVLVVRKDTHTVHTFDAGDGRPRWQFTAGGRIDSPPTVHEDRILFGCTDGRVYCLRASDGALAWRFMAAPEERLVCASGQLESAWPVHGSVLVWRGAAYCVAGRSTWMDGGMAAWGLDPLTGEVRFHARLIGKVTDQPAPPSDATNPYLPAFHTEGARNDLLVTDGEALYVGPLKLNEKLECQPTPYIQPEKPVTGLDLAAAPYVDGETFRQPLRKDWKSPYGAEIGRGPMGDKTMGGPRVFATGGMLDDALFNRTFWMYANIWPGYYKANFGAKAGQLLVVDDTQTYCMRAYNRGYGHSPTFVADGKGYLLFADRNENEPALDDRARNRDKGFGYSRTEPPVWHQWIPVRAIAMVVAGDQLFISGPPDESAADDPYAAIEGRKGASLWTLAKRTGEKLSETALDAPPVFDGLMSAGDRLYLSGVDGTIRCFAGDAR